MSCCNGQCAGIENMFDDKTAKKDLKGYRKNGPSKSTQLLIDSVSENGADGMTLLDIGGGIGAIQHAMLKKGVSSVESVDGSSAYLAAAEMETRRQELPEVVTYRHGNFVEIASELESADIVTMDKVICCFDDMTGLVSASVGLAKKYYAVIFPIDNWLMNIIWGIVNFIFRFVKGDFNVFLHPTEEIEEIIFQKGFSRKSYARKGMWQIIVYAQ